MPLLVASQPEEEVIVFYTQKSPHMNYENVRLLKETEKEAEFIKCFEGSNALDFQLVTQLGYMLCENQENSYVIVSNDTGFDAAVRYWKQRNMPVQRISGKDLSRRLQKKARPDGEKKFFVEPEEKQQPESGEIQMEIPDEIMKPEETVNVAQPDQTVKQENAETKTGGETPESEEPQGQQVVLSEVPEAQSQPEVLTESPETQSQLEWKPEMPEAQSQSEVLQKSQDERMEPEETSAADQMDVPTQLADEKKLPVTDAGEEAAVQKTEISEEQDEIIRSLLTCISKDRLADFHNALVLFFGEETGKELYQEAKNSSAYAICRVNQTAIGEEEKFDVYCQTVFAYSDPKLDCPEDFSSFLYKAGAKRKNLNSLRAALQGHYGKDKGMKYYSLFKSHIKIMNRM